MRCHSTLQLAVATAVALSLTAAAQSIENPSFEEAGSADGLAAKWDISGAGLGRSTSSNSFRSGTAALTYDHGAVTNLEESSVVQNVPGIKAGQRCRFSIQAVQQRGEVGQRLPARMTIRLESRMDQQPVTIAARRYDWRSLGTGADWTLLRLAGTAPTDNLQVVITFTPSAESPRGGWIRLDDASMEVLP
jgi:hypothetical protein